jgi:hypothetical protein
VTSPVSNPYEWEPIRRFNAFMYAEGRWDESRRGGFRSPTVDSGRFADAAMAEGTVPVGFADLYERMARESSAPAIRKEAA